MKVRTRKKTRRVAHINVTKKAYLPVDKQKSSTCKGHRLSLSNENNTYILRIPSRSRKQKRFLTIDTDKFSVSLDGRQINSLRRIFKKAERAEII
jgi:hypothetical protein